MYLHRKHTILLGFLLLCSTHVVFGDFLMKAILHGAAMGMMMRPRFLPIPIPMSSNILSGIGDMFSGFGKQFDSQQQQVIILQEKKPPKPKIIIIQDNEDEW